MPTKHICTLYNKTSQHVHIYNYFQKQYLKNPELFLFPFYDIFTTRK